MEVTENKQVVYEFGRYILDPNERTLFVDGESIHLPAKEFETLLLLVEHNGQALSKEEMIASIWKDAFVEEGNLAKQISRLRKIFESNGEQFIETIPKHGYRFTAEMQLISKPINEPIVIERRTVKRMTFSVDNDLPGISPPNALLPAKKRLPSWMLFASAGLFILFFGAVVWYWTSTGHDRPPIDSIAVLQITPLVDDEQHRLLGLGLADALTTKLGSIRQIVVRPVGSVAQFADDGHDPIEVGRKLDVRAVLTGTILQTDGRLRVNIRLLDTLTGEQIWAERFDGEYTNIFDVEDRISEQAARALTTTLTGVSPGRLTKRYTENAAAYDLYLKGRYYWNKRSEEGIRRAIEYFDEAVERDQNYALAYSGLADSYILLGIWGTLAPGEAFPKAKVTAARALAIDSELAESLVSSAFVKWVYDWDFAGAEREFRRAIEINPNYATAHHWYAYFLVANGRRNEAVNEILRARELEGPLSLSINTDVGEIYCWAGRYEEASVKLEEVIRFEPNYAPARNVLGITYLKQNRSKEAVAELEKAVSLGDAASVMAALGYAYAVSGETGKAKKMIAELQKMSERAYVSRFRIATIQAGLGEIDKAIDALEQEYNERSDKMALLRVYPLLEPLRSHPRFSALEKKVGYSQ